MLRTHSRPEALLPLGRAEWTTRLRRRSTRFFDACPLFSRNSCTSHLVEQGAKGKGAQSPSGTTYSTGHGRFADLDGTPIAGLRTDPGIRSSSVNNDNGPLRPYAHGCAACFSAIAEFLQCNCAITGKTRDIFHMRETKWQRHNYVMVTQLK